MCPDFLRIDGFVISSFGVMVAFAFLVATYLAEKEWNRKKMDKKVFNKIFFIALIGGIAGAKILYIFENVSLRDFVSNPLGSLFERGGFTFYGGFLLAVFLIWLYLLIKKHPILKVGDALSPSLAIGQGIGRIGCFLVGDDYGKPTDLPWAMAFPKGAPPTYVKTMQEYFPWLKLQGPPDALVKVHPTQLYEFFILLIIFLILWSLRKKMGEGKLFALYLILAGTERFLIEFLRLTTPSFIPFLTVAQILALILIITGGIILWLKK